MLGTTQFSQASGIFLAMVTRPGTTPYDLGFEHAFTLVGDGGNHFTNGSIFPGGKTTFIENDTKVNRPGNGYTLL